MLIAGQFHTNRPTATEQESRLTKLAQKYNIPENDLREAARKLPVLAAEKQSRITHWLETVAHSFEQIGAERANLVERLHHIAEMSKLDFTEGEDL